jgi:hypothetical protein
MYEGIMFIFNPETVWRFQNSDVMAFNIQWLTVGDNVSDIS